MGVQRNMLTSVWIGVYSKFPLSCVKELFNRSIMKRNIL